MTRPQEPPWLLNANHGSERTGEAVLRYQSRETAGMGWKHEMNWVFEIVSVKLGVQERHFLANLQPV